MAKPKLFDYLLYTIALAFSLFLLFSPIAKGKANTVTIRTENKEYRYALSKDQILEIEGFDGHTEIEIKDGKVRVLSSSCKNKDCIKRGTIEKNGESIVCLPNKVVIMIEGSGEEEIDAISI